MLRYLPSRALLGAAFLACCLVAPHASAADDDAPQKAPPAEPSPSRWYGWQTLTTDGAAMLLGTVAVSFANAPPGSPAPLLAYGALGTYVLGAPTVHFMHDNTGRAFGSMGLRVGAPIVLAFAGAAASSCNGSGDWCGLGGAAVGFTLGVVAAITVDAAVFAFDDPPPGRSSATAPRLRVGLSRNGVVAFGTF